MNLILLQMGLLGFKPFKYPNFKKIERKQIGLIKQK